MKEILLLSLVLLSVFSVFIAGCIGNDRPVYICPDGETEVSKLSQCPDNAVSYMCSDGTEAPDPSLCPNSR